MAQITIKKIEDKNIWEDFLSKHPEANFLHSWYWGDFHKNLSHQIERAGFYKGNHLVGIMLSVVEPAKRGRYLTVAGGPILDWSDTSLVSLAFKHLKNNAEVHKCAFVRIRPQLISNEISKTIFKTHGFVDAPLHLHAELTSQLDITKSEEDLLANMRKTTRYEIKKALSLGLEVTSSADPKNIRKLYELQLETAKRQKFIPFSYNFLYEQFKVFVADGKALLYSAWHEKNLLAQAFIIFYGEEAIYHYGASTVEGRKYPGSYLLQWEAVREAKKRKMTRYNFWGVSPENQQDHRFHGISIFKRGFGGSDVEYLHAQDLIINRPKYLFNWTIEKIRKKARHV